MNINFCGLEGKIIESSPHGNYLVVELSDRITICGTFSNQFYWQESPDEDSGFISFITYIGLRSHSEANKFRQWIASNGGYFHKGEGNPRRTKRVTKFPLEIKIRGLSPDSVLELLTLQ
ncbi:hypothetical protein [Microseira sp. BLCC-F43]|jgi:hypothetical protein|uniref:hypothetical protein n=1 Tax=Microseira sp. BLCC-F43 TaxID=3153602 RepID=UPI0035B90D71